MQLDFSTAAQEYIKHKGGHLLLFLGTQSGCCAGSLPYPSFELGKPRRSPENYEVIEYSGLTVHVDKELSAYSGKVEIGLEKTLWWNSLTFKYVEQSAK